MHGRNAKRVLVICETRPAGEAMLHAVEAALGAEFICHPVWNREEYEVAVSDTNSYSAVLLGNALGWSDGVSVVEDIYRRYPALSIPIIMITDTNGSDLVAAGFRLGLHDFLRSTQLDRLPDILREAESWPALTPDELADTEDRGLHRDRYRAISAVVPDYLFSFYIMPDGQPRNEWRSDGLRRISGYSLREYEDIGWEQVVHPDDHDVIWQRTRHVLQGDAPVSEYRIITRDGEVRWIREYTRPIWDPAESRYSRFVGSAQDVTEERLSEISRAGQMHTLELIATGSPIERVLDEVISLIELQGREAICAIHRYDEPSSTLALLRSSNIRESLSESLRSLIADRKQNVQSVAVLDQQMTILPDLNSEDQWTEQVQQSLAEGYQSMIVVPIVGTSHNVLGTLTVYWLQKGEPRPAHVERVSVAARLVGVAIEKGESERALKRAEIHYRRLAEEIPAVTFIVSADSSLHFQYLSPQAEAFIGEDVHRRQHELSLVDLVHPDDRRAVATAFQHVESERSSVLIEFRLNDGRMFGRWLQCSAVMIEDDLENSSCWQGILIDVTARRQAEHALRESQTQFRSLFDNNPHLVFTLDTQGRFQRVNPATRKLTGYREDDLIGRPFTSVLVAGELEKVWQLFRRSLQGDPQVFETEIFTNRGSRLNLSVTCVPYIVDGVVAGVSGIGEDITERVTLQKQLSHQAFHDNLTGLPNRLLFDERLRHAFGLMERSGNHIAVLFVDLDNFKIVNDSLGHEMGDEYLKVMASWLQMCVNPMDTVARFGGDEFIVLLIYPSDVPGYPLEVAERIGRELNQPVVIGGHEINTGVSIGIAIQTSEQAGPKDLPREADIALYQAKRAGSNVLYRVFEDAMHQQIVERLEVEHDLRRAIRRDEFVVHYQPIIDLQTGRVDAVEALVRWQHPERGLLAPGQFLPIAEETGQIAEVDAWVLRNASAEIAEWNRTHAGEPPLSLGVNLSARDFRQADLADRIEKTLKETGCDPSWVTFEITESTMMQDVTAAMIALKRLRKLGIGFSLDDFGTGYSSLAYLQRFPLDTLKIDRSFIDGLGGDEDDELMVRTIISLASALSLEVIAEGIETDLQLDRSRELGCDGAQGYLIARPMPFSEMVPLLDRRSATDLTCRFLG